MTFQITGLAAETFAHVPSLTVAELAVHNIQKIVADVSPGFPCRVSLQDAAIGETLYLLNHTYHDEATPYRGSHAIFVREGAAEYVPAKGEVPEVLARRLISIRGFNAAHDMVAADVVKGAELGAAIPSILASEGVAYLHLHNAKPGCFAARVDPVR